MLNFLGLPLRVGPTSCAAYDQYVLCRLLVEEYSPLNSNTMQGDFLIAQASDQCKSCFRCGEMERIKHFKLKAHVNSCYSLEVSSK